MSEHYESHRIEDSSIVRERTAAPCRPHKSTTVAERYYHFNDAERRGTVFFREDNNFWFGSVALCDSRDQFCRATGRTVARRKWFKTAKHKLYRISALYPALYEHAISAYDEAASLRRTKR